MTYASDFNSQTSSDTTHSINAAGRAGGRVMPLPPLYLLTFRPNLKPTIWGGSMIAALKGLSDAPPSVGESWEVSAVEGRESVVAEGSLAGYTLSELTSLYREALVGADAYSRFGDYFPLLVKIIEATDDLSVQVHPGEELARSRYHTHGKDEMWYILRSAPGATIMAGFARELDAATFMRHLESHTIGEVINRFDSHRGDVYNLPAGRIHSIGAGNLLVEVQRSADLTFRVFDYDRLDASGSPRELHVEQAVEAIDFSDTASARHHTDPDSVADTDIHICDFCRVKRIKVNGCRLVPDAGDAFVIMTCIEGSGLVTAGESEVSLSAGNSLLMPAALSNATARGEMTLLLILL